MSSWSKGFGTWRNNSRRKQLFLASLFSAAVLLPAGVAYADAGLPLNENVAEASLAADADGINAAGSSDDGLGASIEPQTQPNAEGDSLSGDDAEGEEPVVTATIHYVVRMREFTPEGVLVNDAEGLPSAHVGLWMVNPEGEDTYLGLGRNQIEAEGSELESDANGNLWWDVAVAAGAEYYFIEEPPPPAGHLLDPYPSELFKLIRETGESGDTYRMVFESDSEYSGHPPVSRIRNQPGEKEQLSGEESESSGSTNEHAAGDDLTTGSPATSSPATGTPATASAPSSSLSSSDGATPGSSSTTPQAKPVATKQASTNKLPNTSDTTDADLIWLYAFSALVLIVVSLNRRMTHITRE